MRSGKGKGAGGPGCTHGGGHRGPLRRPPARKMSPWLWGATCANPRWTQCRGMPEACLRAGGNAGRPGQSSGAVFHYDYTARRFFYMAALPNKQRRSTKEQLQAHDEVGGSCSAPRTSALPKPVLRLRGSDAPLWSHRSTPLVQQRQVAPETRAALLPRGGGAFTRISTLFSGP